MKKNKILLQKLKIVNIKIQNVDEKLKFVDTAKKSDEKTGGYKTKGSDRLCKVIELSMQCCQKLL